MPEVYSLKARKKAWMTSKVAEKNSEAPAVVARVIKRTMMPTTPLKHSQIMAECDEQTEDDTAAGDDAGHPFKVDEKTVEDGHSNDDQKEGQHRFRHCLEVIFEHLS